jgi:hypothetical protein
VAQATVEDGAAATGEAAEEDTVKQKACTCQPVFRQASARVLRKSCSNLSTPDPNRQLPNQSMKTTTLPVYLAILCLAAWRQPAAGRTTESCRATEPCRSEALPRLECAWTQLPRVTVPAGNWSYQRLSAEISGSRRFGEPHSLTK